MTTEIKLTNSRPILIIRKGKRKLTWPELTDEERRGIVDNLESMADEYRNKPVDEQHHICFKCRRSLPVSMFYKRSDSDKPRSICKECEIDYQRQRRGLAAKTCQACANETCRQRMGEIAGNIAKTCRHFKSKK